MKQLLFLLALISPSFAQLPAIDYAGMFFSTVQVSPGQAIRKVPTLPATCTAVGSASSSNAVLYQGRVYQCTSTNTWTFAVGQSAALTSGRITVAGTGGVLADYATLTYNGTTTVTLGTGSSNAANSYTVTASGTGTAALTTNTAGGSGFFRQEADGTIIFRQSSGSDGMYFDFMDKLYWRDTNASFQRKLYLTGTRLSYQSGQILGWTNSATDAGTGGTVDLGFARNAAGVVEINNGSAGTYRDVKLRALESTGYAFASLPASNNGTVLYCSDCTKATPCAGSGNGALAKRLNGAWDCD